MQKRIIQFAAKIKGQFSFFNWMIINGYFRPLLSEQTLIDYLYFMSIPLWDFTKYFKDVTDRLVKQIESNTAELGPYGRYLTDGFWNRDIGKWKTQKIQFQDQPYTQEAATAWTDLKVPRSKRYQMTSKGRRIMGALIELYHKNYPELIAKAT